MEKEQQSTCNAQIAEHKLKNINLFFATYGSFLTGLFSIFQYFFNQYTLFNIISSISAILILGVTYFLAYSKWATTFNNFWIYIEKCADAVGVLNPIVLALSIMLSVSKSFELLIACCILTAAHFPLYLIAGYKCFNKKNKPILKTLLNWCKTNIALLITIALAIVSFILWFFVSDQHDFADLWLNLLSGFISSMITIAVIDRILKKQKDKNEIPLRKAMYRDIQLFTSRFINLWEEMYVQSTESRSEIAVDDLFSFETINSIRNNLDLEGNPNIDPPQNWFAYINSCRNDLVKRGEKIITSYVNFADPDIIQSIHYLINDSFLIGNLSTLQTLHVYDLANHIPRPTLLTSYTPEPTPSESDTEMVSQLLSWCRSQYENLHDDTKQTTIDIYPIPSKICIINPTKPPSSIMTEERKDELIKQFIEWQNRSKE
ncbi:MAG: hypothetical protein E7566_05750 [Ruminococcaceae bacterium]|nr:hypothetical protein [Oscillospiraceae bacterium]